MLLLKGGCETFNNAAARRKWRVLATVRKYRSLTRSITDIVEESIGAVKSLRSTKPYAPLEIPSVAYWQFHEPNGVSPVQNQGIPAVLFCFLYLYMAARGGSDWNSTPCFDAIHVLLCYSTCPSSPSPISAI